MTIGEQNQLSAFLIIEELIRSNVSLFIIAPGSRSTPLAIAAAENIKAEIITHFDERPAGFLAIGYARSVNRPAAVICTSGTAVANLFPAVVESASDNLPLILLTADRPAELLKTSANQTINQINIFGSYPRFQFNLNCSDRDFDPHALLTTVDQAVYRSTRNPAGPVHLNYSFREPLFSNSETPLELPENLESWKESDQPKTEYFITACSISKETIGQFLTKISDLNNGIIIAGHLKTERERNAVKEISRYLQFPILPDITSGLRLQKDELTAHYYDLMLTSDSFLQQQRPQVILHLGGRFVSKRLLQAVTTWQPERYILVNDLPNRLDPSHLVTDKIESDISLFTNELIKISDRDKSVMNEYQQSWLEHSSAIDKIISTVSENKTNFGEATIARLLVDNLHKNSSLFVASSMPIRDLDIFAPAIEQSTLIGSNRGASGIDGTIASACGFAHGHKSAVTLLIGDTALLHDLNSLSLISKLPANSPITIVVINNNGGGIFDHLPIAKRSELLDNLFVQPHGIRFEAAASLFSLQYAKVENKADFVSEYQQAVQSGRSSLIEVTIKRDDSISLHCDIVSDVSEFLNNRLK